MALRIEVFESPFFKGGFRGLLMIGTKSSLTSFKKEGMKFGDVDDNFSAEKLIFFPGIN
jgi:hypothetical protein